MLSKFHKIILQNCGKHYETCLRLFPSNCLQKPKNISTRNITYIMDLNFAILKEKINVIITSISHIIWIYCFKRKVHKMSLEMSNKI